MMKVPTCMLYDWEVRALVKLENHIIGYLMSIATTYLSIVIVNFIKSWLGKKPICDYMLEALWKVVCEKGHKMPVSYSDRVK